jgi:hypothetical protein
LSGSGGKSWNVVFAHRIRCILAILVAVDLTTKVISTASFIKAKLSSNGTVVAIHTAAAFIHGCVGTRVYTAAIHYTALELRKPAAVIGAFHLTALKDCEVTLIVTVHSRVIK